MLEFSSPIEDIPRVGPQYRKKLARLGIKTVEDLVFHFPHRYEDFSNLIPVSQAEPGGPYCFEGEISDIKNIRLFRRHMVLTQATLSDNSGKLKVLWFNQPYLISTFKKGDFVFLAGKVTKKNGSQYLSSPAYEKVLNNFGHKELTHTGRLVPVYPETEGLSSKWLRFIVKPILQNMKGKIFDPFPRELISRHKFLPLSDALWQIHFPDSLKSAAEAKKRFSFEELFNLSLFMLKQRAKLSSEKAFSLPLDPELMKKFVRKLPFELTGAQKKCAWQILKDMEKSRPMNRLLEGDVGSGKTVVAAMAALSSAKAGYQAAFMAPTEILARQHFKTVSSLLKDFDLKVGLITGKESHLKNKKLARKELLEKLAGGKIDILIGTHALVQENGRVRFKNLALAVIAEQPRFGVEQRARLSSYQSRVPHLLSMTATPIPRTLSLTVYGDLDLSVIDEMPRDRKKIITEIIQPGGKRKAYDFIRRQVKEGRQVFVICPRIEPAKKVQDGEEQNFQAASWMEVKAVKEEFEKLSREVFPDLKVAMLHGKMKSDEKEKAMKNFRERKTDILVSTSVVEVGVDIPNASVMMIEGSEKFGLAQLHQFRGRVGRAEHQSYCFLFIDTQGPVYNRRLKALISSQNGFELAEKDLKIRGPGDFIGARQWGIPDLAMSSLSDPLLVSEAREEAKKILAEDPELKNHPLLKERLKNFGRKIHLE